MLRTSFLGVHAIEEEVTIMTITTNKIAHKNRSDKKTANEKEGE